MDQKLTPREAETLGGEEKEEVVQQNDEGKIHENDVIFNAHHNLTFINAELLKTYTINSV